MKTKRLIFVVITIMMTMTLSLNIAYSQTNITDIAGPWIGTLSASGVELRIVFNLKKDANGNYSATMDSPDQGAKGIPLGTVTFLNDSLSIDAPGLMGKYQGVLTENSEFDGKWTQAGSTFDLDLKRQVEEIVLLRPQEPQPPFPYRSKDVEYQNIITGNTLAGTVTYPADGGKYPAVVLVSGSGPQNRDEELMGHKPFAVLADHLSRQGIVVLRYDDRGVGKSSGTMINATSEDFVDDTRAGVEYLFTQDYVDPNRVGVIGHSEGGLIAFMMAAKYDDISFIVSLAGPGVDGRTVIEDQTEYIARTGGIPENIIIESVETLAIMNDAIEKYENANDGIGEINKKLEEYFESKGQSEEEIRAAINNVSGFVNNSSYKWLRFFYAEDPADSFPKIKCPVLALNGSKDCQVLAEINIGAIEAGFKKTKNKNVTTRIFPGLNHLFQHCETGLPGEYAQIEETFSPEVLEYISEWVNSLF